MKESLVTFALLIAVASCQNNIDITVPIVRTVDDVRQLDYFSYSMVLHQLQSGSLDRPTSLDQSRIIVSAPKYNISESSTGNTGAVWSCPVRPGPCKPIRGDDSGADRRLYDMDANGSSENKTNQFLGSSMSSNGDYFIVCAHRNQVRISGNNYLRGMCYYSDRDLSGFQAYSPCSRFGSTAPQGSGVCNAGTSSVVTSTGATDDVYAVGAPGAFLWRGVVTRLDANSNFDRTSTNGVDFFGLLGYTMVAGRFSSTNRLDYAVSNPRHDQGTYRGRVVIVSNDRDLTITNQPLNGEQMGEYYGFSLLAANLAGDSFDELIVGAPMYRAGTRADAGRIFVYSNNNGALAEVDSLDLVGTEPFARFGYALANLGDINGDTYDDIAVSAPFGSGPGSVYIYYSSPTETLMNTPAQRITGADVNRNLLSPLSIRGFGTSLASGVDVDGNTYNDLAVGTIVSQQVYLLRTRPLARVTVELTTDDPIVNLDQMTCTLRSVGYACFGLTVCLRYQGSGLDNDLVLTATLVAERQKVQNNLEQRIFFDNGVAGQTPNTLARNQTFNANTRSCFPSVMAYVQNGITDRFNGFTLEAVITPPELNPVATNGNEEPLDFSEYPVVSTSGTTMIQVETFKTCGQGEDECVPDLRIDGINSVTYSSMSGMLTALTVGAVTQVNIQLRVSNIGDDAFQATLAMRYRTNQLQVQRVFNNTMTAQGAGQLTLTCSETTQDEYTTQTCNIGNPLISGGVLTINTLFSPRPELVGNERNINVEYSLNSVNAEDSTTTGNNMHTEELTVNAMAEVFLDIPGLVFPEVASYSNVPPNSSISSVTELGPSVRTTFVVRNSGPSPVPTVELTVMWPIDGQDTGFNTFVYPASISSMSAATVVCANTNLNPQNLELPQEGATTGEENQVAPSGKKRRRRSVPELGRKVKRQTVSNTEDTMEIGVTRDRTFSCADNVPTLNCVPITCSILGLQGGSSAQVEILSYLDERYLHERNDRFTFTPTASVRIVGADYIVATTRENSAANIRAIPASSINPETVVPPFPWYAVVFPIIAVIIIIAVIAVILYFCGFFRRAKHEEIKQKREELQNLADNGVTAETGGAGDGTNL